jgi:hypothetical protein
MARLLKSMWRIELEQNDSGARNGSLTADLWQLEKFSEDFEREGAVAVS